LESDIIIIYLVYRALTLMATNSLRRITSESVKSPEYRYLPLDWNICHDIPLAPRSRRRFLKEHHVTCVLREETSNVNIRGKEFHGRWDDWRLCLVREWDQTRERNGSR